MIKHDAVPVPPARSGPNAETDLIDVSTWRWHVSVILRAQREAEINPASNFKSLRAKLFRQGYGRRPSLDLDPSA